jgi:hypothetical protein
LNFKEQNNIISDVLVLAVVGGKLYLNVALKREMSVLPNLSNAGFSMFYG